jgi:hypothetical protein
MMRLRQLQEDKVQEAERAFAVLVEMSQMERLPKDWAGRRELCNDVMNRVWGTPKARSENEASGTQTIRVEYVKRSISGTNGAPPETATDS